MVKKTSSICAWRASDGFRPAWWACLCVVAVLHVGIIVEVMGLVSPKLEMRADGNEEHVEGAAMGPMTVFQVETITPYVMPREAVPAPETFLTSSTSNDADIKQEKAPALEKEKIKPKPKAQPKPKVVEPKSPLKPEPKTEPKLDSKPVVNPEEQEATLTDGTAAEVGNANKTLANVGSVTGTGTNADGVEGAQGQQGEGKDAYTAATHVGGYLKNPKPRYPQQSLEIGEEGEVRLRVKVEANGRPSSVQVVKSSGFSRLDRAAKRTVEQSYEFVPAKRFGVPVASLYEFVISFRLD